MGCAYRGRESVAMVAGEAQRGEVVGAVAWKEGSPEVVEMLEVKGEAGWAARVRCKGTSRRECTGRCSSRR